LIYSWFPSLVIYVNNFELFNPNSSTFYKKTYGVATPAGPFPVAYPVSSEFRAKTAYSLLINKL
jgi:hypothetical protein